MAQAFDGQIVVLQAADLVQMRQHGSDQCFGLLTAAAARRKPERLPHLMAYMATIAKASLKYQWPSLVIYDQDFRLEVAGNPAQAGAKRDPSLYAQCFTCQARSAENWCSHCQALDHSSLRCPYKPQKRSWGAAFGQALPPSPSSGSAGASGSVCLKFNRFNGDCRYGRQCRFQHVCSGCGGPHPVQGCRYGKTSEQNGQ